MNPRTRRREQKRKNVPRDEMGYAVCQKARILRKRQPPRHLPSLRE